MGLGCLNLFCFRSEQLSMEHDKHVIEVSDLVAVASSLEEELNEQIEERNAFGEHIAHLTHELGQILIQSPKLMFNCETPERGVPHGKVIRIQCLS